MPFRHNVMSFSLAALLTLACLGTTAQAATAGAPRRASIWQSDFQKASAEAKRLNRPLLMHFYADWCSPCKKMDAEVLNTAELAQQLAGRIVAVKINADQHLELVEKYEIQSLPTDLFLEPGGRIMARSDGFRSKSEYLTSVARVDARWTRSLKIQVAGETKPAGGDSSQGPRLGGPALGTPPVGQNPPDGATPGKSEIATKQSSPAPAAASPTPPPKANGATTEPYLGLDGFSPVTLVWERKWVKGEQAFAAEFKGHKYLMANAEELAEFRKRPELFAPRLMGCDPVVLWKTDRAVPGSTEFGAFYSGELYLFVSPESRSEFKADPSRYIRARHVLRPDQIERAGVRRAAAETSSSTQ